VTLRRDGCAAVDSSVRVTANATQTMSITLKPDGPLAGGETLPTILSALTVTTTPPGAALFINNQPSGTTPYRSEKLTPGNYRLRLELPGYDPMEGSVALKPGESHAVEKKNGRYIRGPFRIDHAARGGRCVKWPANPARRLFAQTNCSSEYIALGSNYPDMQAYPRASPLTRDPS